MPAASGGPVIVVVCLRLQPELLDTLTQSGKREQLASLQKMQLPAGAVSFTRQQAPHGLGHAVWCARDLVGDEPFALLLPDMVSFGKRGCLAGAMELYGQTGGNVIAVEEVPESEVSSYGVIKRGEGADNGFEVTAMVEKPKREEAPSNLIISGRYILQPEIFGLLADQPRGAGGEIQLTDAMQTLMHSQRFTGVKYMGQSFDCGSKIGFLTANVVYALDRDDIRDGFVKELRKLDLEDHL